jgi:hypothetical protein
MTQAAQLDAAAVVLHELRTPPPGAPRRQRPQLVSHIRRQLSAEPSMEGDGIRPEAYEQPSPADASPINETLRRLQRAADGLFRVLSAG